MKLEELKTQGQMLQEINQEYFYNLNDMLIYSTEEQRKEIEQKLVDMDYKQYYEYLDSINFENKDQLESEICKYCEYVNQQPLWMGEMGDISDMADDYIREKELPFNDYED